MIQTQIQPTQIKLYYWIRIQMIMDRREKVTDPNPKLKEFKFFDISAIRFITSTPILNKQTTRTFSVKSVVLLTNKDVERIL